MTCPHDPKTTKGPIGMYHCPNCGEMVIAGCEHPEIELPFPDANGPDCDNPNGPCYCGAWHTQEKK